MLSTRSKTCCNIRLAKPGEGPLIGELVKRWGGPFYDWVDWTTLDPFPYWLIGEIDGIPRGVIMVIPGKPFAVVDFQYTDRTITKRQQAIVVRDLNYAALSTCKQFGAQAAHSTIGHSNASWERIARRRGAVPIDTGTFLITRV